TLNGGALMAPATRRVIHDQPMTDRQYHAILAQLTARQIPCVVYTPENLYCRQWYEELNFLIEIREPRPVVTPDLERLTRVVKVLTFVDRGDHLHEELIRSFAVSGTRVIRTSERLLEYIDERANKGVALQGLAQHLGLPMSAVAAIGDSENDLEMVRVAGCGIAMGNAVAAVKDAADWVVADNDHDGVSDAIMRILNEGEEN
ncbi:MAG: HAD-IIB family hydrolase, partial [Bacillota bacterium]